MIQTLQLAIILGIVICIFGAFLGPGFGRTAMVLGGILIGGALVLGWILVRLAMLVTAIMVVLAVVALFYLVRWLLRRL